MRLLVLLPVLFSYHAFACYSPPDPKYPAPAFLDLDFSGQPWDVSAFDFVMKQYGTLKGSGDPEPEMREEAYRAQLGSIKIEVPKVEYFYYGSGGSCVGNTFESALMLFKQAQKDGVTGDELATLAQLRSSTLNRCASRLEKDPLLAKTKLLTSKMGATYAKYLQGAIYLYTADFPKSAEAFDGLAKGSPSSWVRETATYLKGRVKLVEAQEKWDGYGDGEGQVDKAKVKEAESLFKAYVSQYPKGLYAESAKNMQRRLYFLMGEKEKLNDILVAQANAELTARTLNEFRTHFIGKVDASKDHPILIAHNWMKDSKAVTADDVSRLAKNPFRSQFGQLFALLYAYGLWTTDQTAALASLSNDYKASDLLSVSIEVLKAQALEKQKDYEKAKALWLKVKKDFPKEDAPDLHLLAILLQQGAKDRLFDQDSPITNPKLLTDLAMTLYDKGSLASLLGRKTLSPAKRVHLVREMMRRHLFDREYAAMVKFYDQKGTDFAVLAPAEKDIRVLAQNALDLGALMGVGKFVYGNYVQPNSDIAGNARLYDDDLGRFCPDCASNTTGRFVAYDYFKDVAETLNKAAKKSDLEAEALHFLVKCHKCCEFKSRCGEPQDGSSKKWFTRLHQKYAKSDWAKKTPYYY